MRAHRIVLFAAVIASTIGSAMSACTALNPIPANVCGNSIIEPEAGEQCDRFNYADAFACFASDAGARACHVACGDGGACPTGWGCGLDGVCRQPAASYKLTDIQVPADVRELALADFDGDGRRDVVARGLGVTEIFFFDASGQIAGTGGPISLTRGRVTSGVTSRDAGASLVAFDTSVTASTTGSFSLAGTGVNVWRGQSDRTLTPVLFSSFPIQDAIDSRVVSATVQAPSPHPGEDDIVIFGEAPFGDGGAGAVLATFDVKKGFQPAYVMLATDAGVRNDIPVGRVPPSSPCDSTLVGFKGATSATTYRMCDDAGNVFAPSSPAALPPNVQLATAIDGPVLLVDADHDGVLDVVTGAAKNAVQIALGKSDGTFQAAMVLPVPGLTPPLLAAGFIDGDLVLDFVDTSGVLLSSSPNARIPSTLPLTYAQLRDVNNDGHADVVAISSAGVDFYEGTGSALMNHRLYDIAGATNLALGDLDGDSYLDLVVTANATAPPIYVLWGTPGFPLAQQLVGSLPFPAQHVSTGKLTWFFGDSPDAVSSIVVIAEATQGATTNLVVIPIQGHTNRQLTSPLVLGVKDDAGSPGLSNPDLPLVGALGSVAYDASITTSLAMLAVSPPQNTTARMWTAPVTSSSQIFDTTQVKAPVDGGFSIPLPSAEAAQGLAMMLVDLDPSHGNGDELVAVVPATQQTSGSLDVARWDGAEWVSLSTTAFDGRVRTFDQTNLLVPVKLTHADFDGDGNEDVLLVYETDTDAGFEIDAKILFGDGNGNLVDAAIVKDVTTAAPINALGNGGRQLMTAGPNGLTLYSPKDCGAGVMHCFDAGVQVSSVVENAAIDITCGDVNGDGIADVIVGARAFINVFIGGATLP